MTSLTVVGSSARQTSSMISASSTCRTGGPFGERDRAISSAGYPRLSTPPTLHATRDGRPLAFAAYSAALDREEYAAGQYRQLIERAERHASIGDSPRNPVDRRAAGHRNYAS